VTAPEARRPRPRPGQAERIVVLSGLASIAFGSVIAVLAVFTRPGVGSFGVVPEVIAGFTSILLGVLAIGLGMRSDWIGSSRVVWWLLLGTGIVATYSVVVLAVDDLAGPIEGNRQIATLVVVLGRSVAQAGMVGLIVALVLRAAFVAFGWLLAAWRSRYLR
jgi:hypothetical protein